MQPRKISIKTALFPAMSATIYGDSGDSILLLHGFPANSKLWQDIVPTLSANYQLIIPDLPGVGESILAGQTVSIDELADGMIALLNHLQIINIVVAGHSMGGYVALAIAEKVPERLIGLSLIHSTASPDDDEKKANRKKAIGLIEKGAKEAFLQTSVASLFAEEFKKNHQDVINRQLKESLEVADKTLIAFYNAMMERPSRIDILHKAKFPLQWIIGDDDTVIPKEKGIPQSWLAPVSFVSIYKNTGHMSMLETPGILAKDLTSFAVYCIREKQRNK